MYSLILHGRMLQKGRDFSAPLKLFQIASSYSNSFSSASATAAPVSPQGGRKEKSFTVSYLIAERLQKGCNFSAPVRLLQFASSYSNSFCSASATAAPVSPQDGRKEKTFTVSYLVDSLGFTTKLAESISKKVSSEGKKGNPDSVLSLLRCYGFTDSNISSIVRVYPSLLIADAEKSLAPKLQFLQSRGASTSELTEVLSKVPKILGGIKKDKAISRYYDFVKEIIEADKSSKFKKLCLSLPAGSKQENKLRNILDLRDLGVPQKLLFSLLNSNFRSFSGKERFEQSLKKVVEMGFDPTTFRFIEALEIVYGSSDKAIEEKVDVYRKLGFSVGDVWAIFKRHPKCIGYSSESMNKKIEFVVKQMNWPPKAVALFPQVLGYSMEKRIVPRCNVIRALMSKGLLGDGGSELPSIPSVLACTDQAFVKRYIMKHDDNELVRELMAIFTNVRAS